ncbi:MAG: hypothetical protein MI892_07805 [Desulfobacterales bacterium]|nr:hypothetical protein [Desulfobacterales bacterium]
MYETEQENFWAGQFGNDYIDRNQGPALLAAKTGNFAKILSLTRGVASVIEMGCNIGLNLKAIQKLLPNAALYGVEINETAADTARKIKGATIFCDSFTEYAAPINADLSFTAGVLIHIAPEKLEKAYKALYDYSSKYILIYEYYNPVPVHVTYRGHENKLYKRDFAGEMMELYPDLELLNYGFVYRRDPNYPDDDLNWFLMVKK